MKTISSKCLYRVLAIASSMYFVAGYAQAQPATWGDMPPVTRAGVLRELQELESVGYNPATPGETRYPEDLQQALRKLDVKHRAEAGTVPNTAAVTTRPAQATVVQ